VRYRSLGAIVAVALVLGCDDSSRPMSPAGAERPQASISDGSTGGNPDFFFLPPVLGNPSGKPGYTAGAFNGGWRPVIEVCQLQARDSNVCVSTLKTFSGKDITINAGGEYYGVNWDTRSPSLDLSKFYRVSVRVAGQVLGYFDVDPVSTARLKNEETGDYIALIDGRTLPIKFRIEQGALSHNTTEPGDFAEAVVTNAGGDVVTNTGFAAAHFPAGWLPAPYTSVIVTIARNPVGPTNDCHQTPGMLQFEGCYQFETDRDVGNFALPVRVEVCSEVDEDDALYDAQALFSSDVDEPLTELPGALDQLIDCSGFNAPVITGTMLDRVGNGLWRLAGRIGDALSPTSAFAIDAGRGGTTIKFSRIGWGVPLDIALDGGNGQTGAGGATLGLPLQVLVTGSHDAVPISDVPVSFAVATGGGSVNFATRLTDDGEASVDWTLGTALGAQSVTASISTVAHAPGVETLPRVYTPVTKSVTFTATAVNVTIISGTVTTDPGTGMVPVPGATVQVITPGGPVASTTSDASGNYTLVIPATTGTVDIGAVNATSSLGATQTGVVLTGAPQTINFVLFPIIG
jgi:hypothetical protein